MDTEELPDFLSDDHIVTPELQDAPPAAPETPSQDRAPEASPAPAPAPATEPEAAPAAPPETGDPTPAPAAVAPPAAVRDVPLAAFLEMREKMQRAERALADRQAQEAIAPPDRNVDPEGYEQHQQAHLQAVLFEQRRDLSRTVANVQHGEEVVNAAFDWAADACDRYPGLNKAVWASANPAGFVVGEYQRMQREQALSDVSVDDIAAFRQWKANLAAGAQEPGAVAPQLAAAAQAAPVAPRRSLASAPSAGASAAPEGQDGEQVFDGMFGK